MSALTQLHMMGELERLLRVFSRPKHFPDDVMRLAQMFLDIVAVTPAPSAEQVTLAVTAYLAGDHAFFPKPGHLRALARLQRAATLALPDDLAARYRAWEGSADAVRGETTTSGPVPCPVCGERYRWQVTAISPDGGDVERWECWHNHLMHLQAGIMYSGRLRSPIEVERLEAKLNRQAAFAEAVRAGVEQSRLPVERVAHLLAMGKEIPAKAPAPTGVA